MVGVVITLTDGIYKWFYSIFDNAGNNFVTINNTATIDSINPSIILSTSFSNNGYINYNTSIKFNLTISDANLNTCWYNLDNLGDNNLTCGTNLSLNLSEGFHFINFSVNDTLNHFNSTNISFTTDLTFPVINNLTVVQIGNLSTANITNNITDVNIDSCKYSIYKNGSIEGLHNNLSISCINDGYSVSLGSPDTYELIICGIDLANNENCTNESFIMNPSSIFLSSGGGGGGIASSNQSVVAIVKINNSNLTDLQRSIIYVRIREICLNKTSCIINNSQLIYLQDKLMHQGVNVTLIEINEWLKNYNNNLLEQVNVKQIDSITYQLSKDIIQIQKRKLELTPAKLDPFFAFLLVSNEFHYEISSNKVIKNITIIGDSEIYINKTSDTTFEVILKVSSRSYSAKTYKALVNVIDLDGNSAFLDVSIRSINPLGVYSIIFILLVIVLIIFRKNLMKVLKKL
jgi:hypothetical protein